MVTVWFPSSRLGSSNWSGVTGFCNAPPGGRPANSTQVDDHIAEAKSNVFLWNKGGQIVFQGLGSQSGFNLGSEGKLKRRDDTRRKQRERRVMWPACRFTHLFCHVTEQKASRSECLWRLDTTSALIGQAWWGEQAPPTQQQLDLNSVFDWTCNSVRFSLGKRVHLN